MKIANAIEKTSTTPVERINSSRVGQLTFENSMTTSFEKVLSLRHIPFASYAWKIP